MCGIFLLFKNFMTPNQINQMAALNNCFKRGQSRGPEFSTLTQWNMGVTAGFHRLAINGLDVNSNQPITVDSISIICNGEIYNYKELYKMLGVTKPQTNSDCEVIIHMYKKYGIEYTLKSLDGVFAFALQDNREQDFSVYLARDPYGVRPLYQGTYSNMNISDRNKSKEVNYCFASEMKSLSYLNKEFYGGATAPKIVQFKPGTYSKMIYPNKTCGHWKHDKHEVSYTQLPFSNFKYGQDTREVCNIIKNSLIEAVNKRVDNTDRPIACLLSGGLDSSLITALVNKIYDKEKNGKLKTFSIGMPGSEDLIKAKKVADFLDTDHTSIEISEDDFFNAIPKVIYAIESYDTTTVRASVGNYLISEYISKNCNAKVIFNGDGADEVMGGYLYFHKCPDSYEFDKECRRLVNNIHTFDVQRSDRCISSNGLEPRTPFLDRNFVQTYFSLSQDTRYFPDKKGQCEKYLIRKAFDSETDPILPKEILWRVKEAFSDGVSSQKKSWFQVIQDKIDNLKLIKSNTRYFENIPATKEQRYYRDIFEKFFKGNGNVLPYFWMPNYVDNVTDSSARTLDVYKDKMKTSQDE